MAITNNMRSFAVAALWLSTAMPASASEPSRGFPYRASPLECLSLDGLPRQIGARDRRIVDALARRGPARDGEHCTVKRLTRYGGYAPVSTWNVLLQCAGRGAASETWVQNSDGSVTIERAGSKTTVHACERSAR